MHRGSSEWRNTTLHLWGGGRPHGERRLEVPNPPKRNPPVQYPPSHSASSSLPRRLTGSGGEAGGSDGDDGSGCAGSAVAAALGSGRRWCWWWWQQQSAVVGGGAGGGDSERREVKIMQRKEGRGAGASDGWAVIIFARIVAEDECHTPTGAITECHSGQCRVREISLVITQ